MGGEFDIRLVCRNYVRYLREAVDMMARVYLDVDVVDSGTELGPCIYQTLFRASVDNPEDTKAVALAVARINEFIRDVKARLAAYNWEVFEKEAYVEGAYVYMVVRWVKKIRIPGKTYTSVMDIYELALPYMREGAKPSVVLAEAA